MITLAEDESTPKRGEPAFCGHSVYGDRGGPFEACGKPLPCAEHPSIDWRKRAERAKRLLDITAELLQGVRIDPDVIAETPLDDDDLGPSLIDYLALSPWYESASPELRGYYDELVRKSAEVKS